MGLVPVVLCLVIVLNNQLYMYPPGQSLITTLYGVLRTKVGSCAEERPEVRISCWVTLSRDSKALLLKPHFDDLYSNALDLIVHAVVVR